jgi:type 1 glutamine amidotransferase
VRAGALGVLAIHSATDSCYAWDHYGRLVGARFDGQPWTQTFTADVVDPAHPACAHLGAEWTWHDEVYQFRDLRPDARVLLRVRDGELDPAARGAAAPSFGYPLAWCFSEGGGRVFSTSLGHFPAAWESPAYLRHVQGGLRWILDAA